METTNLKAKNIIIMMSMRVPGALVKFNTFILRVVKYLNTADPITHITNGERLGLLVNEMNKLNAMLHRWIAAYAMHTDPQQKSKITRVTVMTFIKEFKSFFSPILNRFDGSSNCTNEDRLELNIAIKKPFTRRKTQIKDLVFEMAIQLGGGMIKIICRTSGDSFFAGIHPLARGWFIAYDIVDHLHVDDPQHPTKVKKSPPRSPEECLNSCFYSSARAVINLGAEHKGRSFVYFIRWYDFRNPHLSGPYGPAKTVMIL